MDEADAFLQSRETNRISEDQRNDALNALLFRAGTESNEFMYMQVTNLRNLMELSWTVLMLNSVYLLLMREKR